MKKRFFIFGPLFYTNSNELHVGHGYNLITCNSISLYKKMRGYDVYFQTGSDEHGEKIFKTAREKKMDLSEMINSNVNSFKSILQSLDIRCDLFFRTTDLFHIEKVQNYFLLLLRKGDIYFNKYIGNYCFSCEMYVNESVSVLICPTEHCGKSLERLEEKAYFFKISKYGNKLKELYSSSNNNILFPDFSRKELFDNFIGSGVSDLCITRSDVTWGIPVPSNEYSALHGNLTIYVWFDALLNYITSENGEICHNQENVEIINVVGRDILRFHALIWVSILLSLNKRLPNKIISHGLLVTNLGNKMSKSIGNVINLTDLLAKWDKEIIKCYLVSEISLSKGGNFSEDALKSFNEYLVNKFGNLLNRVIGMIVHFRGGLIPNFDNCDLSSAEIVKNYRNDSEKSFSLYLSKMDEFKLDEAFSQVKEIINSSNLLISKLELWKVWKENNNDYLIDYSLNSLSNSLIYLSYMIYPPMPEKSSIILSLFGMKRIIIDEIEDFSLLSPKGNRVNIGNFKLFNKI